MVYIYLVGVLEKGFCLVSGIMPAGIYSMFFLRHLYK